MEDSLPLLGAGCMEKRRGRILVEGTGIQGRARRCARALRADGADGLLPRARGAAWNGPGLRFVLFAALCLQGTSMDTISGLHASKRLASFSPKKTGSFKVKGMPGIDKLKASLRRVPAGKQRTRTSATHLRRMLNQADNATVMENGCDAMWKICLNANEQDALGRTRGACAAVAVTLKKHLESESTVLTALKLACNLCYAQPKSPFGFAGWAHTYSQNELGEKLGAISDIVKAMTQHAAYAPVQDAGIRALSNLVYNHTENALRATRDHGVQAVFAAMEAHPEDMMVQEAGCTFVWSILACIRNESYITYGLEMTGAPGAGQVAVNLSVAGRLAELGAVPRVIQALNSHGCSTQLEGEGFNVGEQGCAALWFLSVRPGRLRATIVAAGGEALARKVLHAQQEVPPGSRMRAPNVNSQRCHVVMQSRNTRGESPHCVAAQITMCHLRGASRTLSLPRR